MIYGSSCKRNENCFHLHFNAMQQLWRIRNVEKERKYERG